MIPATTETTPLFAGPTAPAPTLKRAADLLTLFRDPAAAGRRANETRARAFADRIWIRPAPPLASAAPRAQILRGAQTIDPTHPPGPDVPVPPDMPPGPGPDHPENPADPTTPDWPDPHAVHPGDRLILRVDPDDLAAYCSWLVDAAAALPADTTLAPFSALPGGLHRLHLIAAARLGLPPKIRVEVRHDLIGIRLAQVALNFGADTLAGPVDHSRHLPLAALPRPSETTLAALSELVRQAGLDPRAEGSPP